MTFGGGLRGGGEMERELEWEGESFEACLGFGNLWRMGFGFGFEVGVEVVVVVEAELGLDSPLYLSL